MIKEGESTNKDDNVMSAKEKIRQIKAERKKGSFIAKIAKYCFYFFIFLMMFLTLRFFTRRKQFFNDENTENKTELSTKPTLKNE
jgi:hypothetical protein